MEILFQFLKNQYHLSKEAEQALNNCFSKIEIEKNNFIIKEQSICRHLYFLEAGCVRGYYKADGKEVTHWFGFENDFVTSFHSFITNQPAVENIQAVEDSLLWAITADDLKKLFNQFHEIERIVRLSYEKYYIRLEERYVNAQFKTASELYEDLIQSSPHILQRMPLGFVASYLGISQETLSRIRGKF